MTHPHLTLVNANGTPAFLFVGHPPARMDSVFGATYAKGNWLFPAFRPVHRLVIADLKKVCPPLRLDPRALAHYQDLETPLELPPDFDFITKPFAHQLEGLLWAYNNPRAGLFFDPGLGKCKITVDLYRLVKLPMLILCPQVVLNTWAREFKLHGHVDDVVVFAGSPKVKDGLLRQMHQQGLPAAVVTTYETATSYVQQLQGLPFGYLVLDESHRIKAITSLRTRAALMISEKIPRRLLLSGTPTLGSPFSLYPQLRLLGHFLAPENWTEFRKKFGVYDSEALRTGALQQVLGFKNLSTMNTRVNAVCVRKQLVECVDLPPRTIIDHPVPVSGEQRDLYNEIVDEYTALGGEHVKKAYLDGRYSQADGPYLPDDYVYAPDAVVRIGKIEQVLGGFLNSTSNNPGVCNGCSLLEACVESGVKPFTNRCAHVQVPRNSTHLLKKNGRLEALEDLLEDLLADDHNKVIIWTRYIAELDLIEQALSRLGHNRVRVQGGMPIEAFEGAMNTFNTDPHCRVYLGQVASGIGVTLNAANYMVYYNLPWSLEQYLQSLARNYRINQGRPVTVYRLVSPGTIDEIKAAVLDQKIVIEAALTDPEYAPVCARHARGITEASCTCDGTIDKLVARLRTI